MNLCCTPSSPLPFTLQPHNKCVRISQAGNATSSLSGAVAKGERGWRRGDSRDQHPTYPVSWHQMVGAVTTGCWAAACRPWLAFAQRTHMRYQYPSLSIPRVRHSAACYTAQARFELQRLLCLPLRRPDHGAGSTGEVSALKSGRSHGSHVHPGSRRQPRERARMLQDCRKRRALIGVCRRLSLTAAPRLETQSAACSLSSHP